MGGTHVWELWQRHKHVQVGFPELQRVDMLDVLREVRDGVRTLTGAAEHQAPGSLGSEGPSGQSTPPRCPESVQTLLDALERQRDPELLDELRAIAATATEGPERAWAQIVLLEELNTFDDLYEMETRANWLLQHAQARQIRAWEGIARVRLGSVAEHRFLQVYRGAVFMPTLKHEQGLDESDVRFFGLSMSEVVALRDQADRMADAAVLFAQEIGDPKVLILALEALAQGSERRHCLGVAVLGDKATREQQRSEAAYEALIEVARAHRDGRAAVAGMYGYARALWAFGKGAVAQKIAARALEEAQGQPSIPMRPSVREVLSALAEGRSGTPAWLAEEA